MVVTGKRCGFREPIPFIDGHTELFLPAPADLDWQRCRRRKAVVDRGQVGRFAALAEKLKRGGHPEQLRDPLLRDQSL